MCGIPIFRLIVMASLVTGLVACGTVPQSAVEEPKSGPSGEVGPRLQAVVQMAETGSAALERGDYEAAIAAAERGLRIDRRMPELYLILAHSYRALGNPARARQFAQQGLRYVEEPAGETGRALEDLLMLLTL